MKRLLLAAAFATVSGAALAAGGPANSTNQHDRDRAQFERSIPNMGVSARDERSAERQQPKPAHQAHTHMGGHVK